MKKVRAAIVGYGNIGHYVLEALQAAPDFEIAGVIRRAGAENKPEELANYAVVKDIKELGEVDVAILCTPTRSVEKYAKEYLAMGINTVDSFDINPNHLHREERPIRDRDFYVCDYDCQRNRCYSTFYRFHFLTCQQFLLSFQNFTGQADIGLRARTFKIINQNRLAV